MKKTLVVLTLLSAIHFASFAQTQIIAHRGAWKNTKVPQNSLASLNKAVEQKAWGSEFDVHLTKDDVLVVNHDQDFYGMDIATSTYQELLSKKHPNGESIPTAEAYLREGLKQKGTKLIYELKTNKLGTERTLKSAEMTIALVKKLKAEKQVEYIAFSYDACLKLRELDKKAKVHYLTGDKAPEELKRANLSGLDYHLSVYKKNPSWINEAKKLKLETNVWTVNNEEDMRYFIEQNIDYITTDEPELLNTILKK
ncbi:glycerophosphoryl diester phosphodiesterase [Sphingobacterium allocomposti]|uniref:Glycerophosphoryl diester phosphodiesterase n=1 Tax=Sphingobacterium allocomposti TaxID=415956 RepID=A0A5S5DLR6_9SPHI|nr:glycerophosphodiester phosphodiesterase family protein [Sphingobacterium composti Yoo et al. 2007 non Ten et al. 2007]TYP95996.1 glycerophosphoryl diester phosphodiesterase [Sphingobacterium composti Yoo et al. 2007 non Ten et al. 2007]HLS95298.1 glycerophosphodiester phosphodiesterase family protein [Sphingobacterium sp.]